MALKGVGKGLFFGTLNTSEGMLENQGDLGDGGGGTPTTISDGGTVCTGSDTVEDRRKHRKWIRNEAENTEDIRPQFALAIAWEENELCHCRNGEVSAGSEGSKGVMQIYSNEWDGTRIQACSDLNDVNSNIECGVKIMQYYWNEFVDAKNGDKKFIDKISDYTADDTGKTARNTMASIKAIQRKRRQEIIMVPTAIKEIGVTSLVAVLLTTRVLWITTMRNLGKISIHRAGEESQDEEDGPCLQRLWM